jgi:NADPH:quinone reductase-like Zn-dependent oxidoreductase
MPPPGNAVGPPPLGSITLRQDAKKYPAINPEGLHGTGKGKNVLVTGSGRGIGKAIAQALAEAGYNVGQW